ncbi:1744_t:CDS:1 [Diversispora eburnea]|uniref:1744_t:CDS:1 n=1 Tax=Diversispora eburnea TaxID=1213867 RepID=A0A9N8WGE4_9GLOM|nr:1744_t:CDS:1 [Diversispora eburnea]
MSSIQKKFILDNIKNHLSRICRPFHYSNSLDNISQSPFRQQLFDIYGYSIDSQKDESTFTSIFKHQLSNELFAIDDCELEKIVDIGSKKPNKVKYKEVINEIKNYIEQKCREHKLLALRNYFILPAASSSHLSIILRKINDIFKDMLFDSIRILQVSVKFHSSNFLVIEKQINTRFDEKILQVLEAYFNENNRPDKYKKGLIARQTNLSEKQVDIWFNNRRSRTEKGDTDYEKLTYDFLEKKFDWTEKFTEIDSDSLTSKDMIQIIAHAFNLRYTEEEETSQATDDTIEESASETVEVSIPRPTRSRAKAVRNSVAPYSKNRPNKCTQSDSIVINEISEDIQVNALNLGNLENSTIVVEPESSIILRNYEKRHLRNHCLAARNAATPYTKSCRNKITVTSFSKDQIIFSEVSKLKQFSVEMESLQTISPNENETQFLALDSTQNRTSTLTNFSNTDDFTSQYFNTDFSPYNFISSENTTFANEFAYNNDFSQIEFMANTIGNEESFDYNRFSIIE